MLKILLLPLAIILVLFPFCSPAWGRPASLGPAVGLPQSAVNSAENAIPDPKARGEFDKYIVERNAVDQKYYKQYYEYLTKINQIQINKFIWQDRASEVTLWLVVIVVISGLSMSAFQLLIAFRRPDHSTDTTIDISAQNFRVTSSVVGIVVLLISIGFLFLFLREVYNIKMVSTVETADEQAPVADSTRQQKVGTQN